MYFILILCISLYLLYRGADYIVERSSKLALDFGVTPITIALTIIALGTSAPELLTGLMSAFQKRPDFVIGNIIGGNIANVALIVGVASMIRRIQVKSKTLRLEIPFVTASSLAFLLASIDGLISRFEGFLFLLAAAGFMAYLVREAKKENFFDETIAGIKAKLMRKAIAHDLALCALGIAMLVVGAGLLVSAAIGLGEIFAVSEVAMGITVIALGTTIPELVTALVATARKNNEIIIGNAIGSFVLNIFVVIGLTAFIFPIPVSAIAQRLDIPFMLIFAFVFLIMLRTKYFVSRLEGLLLFSGYVAYIFFVVTRIQ